MFGGNSAAARGTLPLIALAVDYFREASRGSAQKSSAMKSRATEN